VDRRRHELDRQRDRDQFFTGPIDQKLTVSSGELSAEPYDIREDDC